MALQPGFFTGPPPTAVKATIDRSGNVFYGVNPDLNRWIQNLWNWTVKFGNNADGAAAFSGKVQIGTSPNWFVADSNGIYLGGATFALSPFRVSMAGAMTASNVDVTGGDITTSGHVNATGGYSVGGKLFSISGVPSATDGGGGYFTGKGVYGAVWAATQTGCTADAVTGTSVSGSGYAGNFAGNASKPTVYISPGVGQYAIDTPSGAGTFNGVATGNLVSGGALGTPSSGTLTNCTLNGSSIGTWTTETYAAGNFTAGGSMTWTVDSGDQTTFAYTIVNKTMTVQIMLDATTIGGTPSNLLKITIPASKVATKRVMNTCFLSDNGTAYGGQLVISAGSTYIEVYRFDVGNFSASTNNTAVYGQITFEIN